MHRTIRKKHKTLGRRWLDYTPLIEVIAAAGFAALAKQCSTESEFSFAVAMTDFMGFFLVIFALLKLFDLEGFADGFQMYDLVAHRFRTYAYVYPFIEGALGFGFLAQWNLPLIYAVTIVIMAVGTLGVFNALRKGLKVECTCMGSVLYVPLSTVALVEDLGMATLATVMLATFYLQ